MYQTKSLGGKRDLEYTFHCLIYKSHTFNVGKIFKYISFTAVLTENNSVLLENRIVMSMAISPDITSNVNLTSLPNVSSIINSPLIDLLFLYGSCRI